MYVDAFTNNHIILGYSDRENMFGIKNRYIVIYLMNYGFPYHCLQK